MKEKTNIKFIIALLGIICFILLAIFINKSDSLIIDEVGYNFVSSYIKEVRTPLVKKITNFGSAKLLIPIATITMIIFFIMKRKKDSLMIGFNLFLVTLLNIILKNIFRRTRPSLLVLVKQGGYSFPSGHTMASTAFYGYLIYLIYKDIKNKYLKWTLIILLTLLIILVGSSRIYLGVHYTTDVLAGLLLTVSYLLIFIGIDEKRNSKKKNIVN